MYFLSYTLYQINFWLSKNKKTINYTPRINLLSGILLAGASIETQNKYKTEY